MSSMGVEAVLAMLLLFVTSMKAQEGTVTFEGDKFTMTCPGNVEEWNKDGKKIPGEKLLTRHYNSETKGLYSCTYKSEQMPDNNQHYYFYVKGKACANCIELDGKYLFIVICADMSGTVILMMIIYKCTKKKSSAGPTHSSKAPARGGRAPPVPSPTDYEPLNVHTRSQDPYSVVNRMG